MEPDERTPAAASGPEPAAVELELHPPGAAVVTLRGEHDLATREACGDALARAGEDTDVLVDLSGCTFLDSTMIGLLVHASQVRSERGRRLELTIPPAAQAVHRVAAVAGLATFLRIHETRDAGLASILSA